MNDAFEYSARERVSLWTVALLGFLALNGAFVTTLVFRPDTLRAAMMNPLASALMIEAFVMVGVLAYLLQKWRVTRLHWGWFVILSLIGSVAFALPIAVLWKRPIPPKRDR